MGLSVFVCVCCTLFQIKYPPPHSLPAMFTFCLPAGALQIFPAGRADQEGPGGGLQLPGAAQRQGSINQHIGSDRDHNLSLKILIYFSSVSIFNLFQVDAEYEIV